MMAAALPVPGLPADLRDRRMRFMTRVVRVAGRSHWRLLTNQAPA
jgi:hypothetical protein